MDLMGNALGYAKTAKKGLPKWGFLEVVSLCMCRRFRLNGDFLRFTLVVEHQK